MHQHLASAPTEGAEQLHQAQRNAAQTPSSQPGRSAKACGRSVRLSAKRHSSSISSGHARSTRPETGARAANHGPAGGRTVARPSHRQTSATPARYQSPPVAPSSRASVASQSATKSCASTRRFSAGTRAASAAVSCMGPGSQSALTVLPARGPGARKGEFSHLPAEVPHVRLGTALGEQRAVPRPSLSVPTLCDRVGGPRA